MSLLDGAEGLFNSAIQEAVEECPELSAHEKEVMARLTVDDVTVVSCENEFRGPIKCKVEKGGDSVVIIEGYIRLNRGDPDVCPEICIETVWIFPETEPKHIYYRTQ
ncbi:MAG TPA: hypothetical protein P5096_04165 [Patescibacteria group bacterium]|nr:hypothetical protein [Patescibacteria group bacterium]